MCDTLGRIGEKVSYFAKNSDRSPNEAQVLEYHPARRGLSGDLQCTYIAIPEAAQTNAVLLSRPKWMWGAEMGVNEHGLCIGNEAVFTRGAYGKSGLTGMDLLRLALERCSTANEAAELILELLEHADLTVGCKARQNSRRMKIVKQLSAEFQIQLSAELLDPVAYMLRLHFKVFIIVKTDFHTHPRPQTKYTI